MWTIHATALSWMLGAELPDGDVQLGSLPEGEVSVRRVSQEDQDRWRDSRHKLMRGYGALGDTDEKRAYPFLPIPEWLLDCCTAATEVRAERVDMAGEVTFEPHEVRNALWFAGLHDIGFRATQAADLIRLLVEPNLQVVLEEQLVTVDTDNRRLSLRDLSPAGFRQRYRELRWSLNATAAPRVVAAWESAAYGPNAPLIRFPMRRLGLAAQRPFAEDRIVDLWIGLDGLFKRDTEVRGIGIKAARKASALIGADVGEQRTLARKVPRSYDVRGAIVHGRSDYSDEEVEDAIDVADSLLRRSLVALIERTEAIDPTADPLDTRRQEAP